MTRRHLIIGTGPAALSALDAIRRATGQDEVTLVGREDCLPYSPASLPYVLAGSLDEEAMWLRDHQYFNRLGATLVLGREVVRVSPEGKSVTFHDGTTLSYDTLLIASGAEPVNPPIPGLREAGPHTFRTLADCRRLVADLAGTGPVAILGAGLVGIHLAAALLARGHEVQVIEKERGILPACLVGEAQSYLAEVLQERGGRLITGESVKHVERRGTRIEIALSGASLVTDMLVNATGVSGRVAFLEGTGMKTAAGIPVDRRMETGTDSVYAAGDVAEAPDFFTGESGPCAFTRSAVVQGSVAGTNMAGGKAEYEGGIPMTAFSFFGNRVFSIGLLDSPGEGQVVTQSDARGGAFRRLVFSGDRLVGAILVNDTADPGVVLELVRRRVDLAPHMAALLEGTQPLSEPWMVSLKSRPEQSRHADN